MDPWPAILPASPAAAVDPIGLAYALGAGFCWAIYIVFGKRAGAQVGGQSTAIGVLIGTLVILPFGIAEAGSRLLSPSLLPAAIGVALLSSALPYSLEMFALPRMPTRTFGVLMSLEPALAATRRLRISRRATHRLAVGGDPQHHARHGRQRRNFAAASPVPAANRLTSARGALRVAACHSPSSALFKSACTGFAPSQTLSSAR